MSQGLHQNERFHPTNRSRRNKCRLPTSRTEGDTKGLGPILPLKKEGEEKKTTLLMEQYRMTQDNHHFLTHLVAPNQKVLQIRMKKNDCD